MSTNLTYTGAGTVTGTNGLGYHFAFASLKQEHIQVVVVNPSGVSTTKTVTTDYTIESYNANGSSNAHIKFLNDTRRGFTNSQSDASSYKVKISRQTPADPLITYTAGASVTASDLNTSDKQALFLHEENKNNINSLAAGDSDGAIQINGSNIANNSITTNKILDLEVGTSDLANNAVTTGKIADDAVTTAKIPDDNVTANKLKSSSSTDSDRAVTTNHIRDGAVTDAKLSTISGSKVTPNFGSQNISTTGTLNAGTTTTGTTTTGSTTSQDLTITNNLTLSSGNADNKGLIFPTDIGGGSGDKAYIRYYVDGTGENTRLHIGNENDGDDDIYLQGGLVHTSGNFTVNGTCTANSFSGNGSGLSGLGNVRQIQETASTGESSTNSTLYADKVTLSVGTASNTRVMIFFGFEMKHSSSNNSRVYAKFTGSNYSPVSGEQEFSQTGNAYNKYTGQALDIGSHSGTRTYRIQFRRANNTGYIKNAYLVAIAFNV